MSALTWILWGLLLVVQNASFTLVSRARNSKSLWYHGWASVLSNGIWFISQFILIDNVVSILKKGTYWDGAVVALFYTACTMVGSLGMHWVALAKLEKG